MIRLRPHLRSLQSHVSSGQIPTREYLESFEPKSLRRLKVFDQTPPEDIRKTFFEKLTSHYSNPRSILRLYRKYISVDDYPCYSWLVRCFCQLGNSFSFNSFWSPRDRQALVSLPLFRYLVFDLIERKHYIHPRHVPRMIFALSALEYRSWPLLTQLLELVQKHLKDWRISTMAIMVGCLVKLGLDNVPHNSNVLTNVTSLLLNEIESRDPSDSSPFDWAILAYSLVLTNRYEWPNHENASLPIFLSRACNGLNLENLPLSGWTQYYLYISLYCTDVEKPRNEVEIKESVPPEIQQSLHTRWLNEILIHSQPQGSEMLQKDVDTVLEGLGNTEGLINCSVGRGDDEQHCLFTGHLFPNRKLCFEYNYLMPMLDGTPVESGLVSFRRRLFNKFGYNTAVIHRHQWENLTILEKEEQLLQILSKFPIIESSLYESKPEPKTFEGSNYKYLKHLRPKITTWPPDKITL
uniref:RAP domain-containing protein n=1 Tax=Theileria annulata TaxID=5874 RepID=A0A3B0MFL5_THEAN